MMDALNLIKDDHEEVKTLLENFVLISHEEHHIVDYILQEMPNTINDENVWKTKLDVLKENIERHIDKEERKLLPVLKKSLSKQEREDLGEKMNTLKSK